MFRSLRTPLAGVALATAAIVGLAGCSAADPEPVVVTGGVLDFALGANPGCLDPHQTTLIDSLYVSRQTTESLVAMDTETGEILPWLADSWEVNDDATVYTFTLHEGVTFSDGDVFDAEAVKANFDAMTALGALATRAQPYISSLVSTEVVDEYVVALTFSTPNAPLLSGLSTINMGMHSPTSLALTPEERCQGLLADTGPFVIDSYTTDVGVSLIAREDYDWAPPQSEHTGRAILDGIEFTIIPESSVRIGSLLSGQIDAMMGVQPQDEAQIVATDGVILSAVNPGIPMQLNVDVSRPIMSDENVRVAVMHAINREEIKETVLSDAFPVSTSILTAGLPGYADLSEYMEFDTDLAEELLDDSGWVLGSDGVRTKDGQPLSLLLKYASNNNYNRPAMELVQLQLASIGIAVELVEFPGTGFTDAREARDWDLFLSNSTDVDPNVMRSSFSARSLNYHNLPEPESTEMADLYDLQRVTADPAERADLVAQIQEEIVSKAYSIPIFDLAQVIATTSGVSGVVWDTTARPSLYAVSVSE